MSDELIFEMGAVLAVLLDPDVDDETARYMAVKILAAIMEEEGSEL